ncbi:hypothetical protein ACFSAG_07080 [Sphingorhabdus buctiana]|uniref:Uncharacterized protein n=1 Tax=Sphingorhabdus buctiana TaxID=1508805 RepID=A0ABW4MDQ4_9SPHN|nr:hypothetical protein [Sphingopyxis macrogoltabida]MBL0116205.1 hypothetical protein [Sphingomonadales bacterium]MBO6776425.1 hypothetical protein [Marinibacterium sp.]
MIAELAEQASDGSKESAFFEIVDALPSRPNTDLVFGAELRDERRRLILLGKRSCEMPQALGQDIFDACIREHAQSNQMTEIKS